MKISYECSDLIEELKHDIIEFGDIDIYAFYKEIGGNIFITDYDFIDNPLNLQKDETAEILKASKVLKLLEEQNRIF